MTDQIRDGQSELQRSLGRVEGKLDAVLEHLKGQDDKHSNLEARVRTVETRQLYFTGIAAAATFFLTKVDFTKLLSVAHAAGV